MGKLKPGPDDAPGVVAPLNHPNIWTKTPDYQAALSDATDATAHCSDLLFRQLFNLASQGAWAQWNAAQPEGTTIAVSLDDFQDIQDPAAQILAQLVHALEKAADDLATGTDQS